MKYASRTNINFGSNSSDGSHFVAFIKWLLSVASLRLYVSSNLLFIITVLLLLVSFVPSARAGNLNGEKLVQDVTNMVKPEVQNFAGIALGAVFAVFLVRSFK